MPPRNVHLVGSVPLANAREVFETVSAALGPRLLRIPDGETGERSDWITWLEPVFADHPAFEKSNEVFRVHATGTARTRYRLRPGASLDDVAFDNLFYADVAIASYRDFAQLKQQGKIPAQCRFQVDLVPAHSVIWLFLQEDLHQPVDPIFNAALRREIDKLAAAIPHDQLAIQFDVASAVFARLQRNERNAYGRDKDEMLASFGQILVELGNHVPADIELLFHFCYGDSNHRRHGRHGRGRQSSRPRDQPADPADPHAGSPRPLGRHLFRAVAAVAARAGNAARARPGALHRRDRGHAPAPRHGGKICEQLRDRDRMRVWPAATGYDTGAAAHPCRSGWIVVPEIGNPF
jgi:hypothetical protein